MPHPRVHHTSGIILQHEDNATAADARKGTRVLLELTELWQHSDCLVTAAAYFASIEAAMAMKDKGLYFIGNVKECSMQFPMEVLSNTTLSKQVRRSVLASINKEAGKTELVAISWLNRNRHLFVMSTCSIWEGGRSTAGSCVS